MMGGIELKFVYDDGGRAKAGFKGKTGDCGVRAVAIATGMPYKSAYDLVNEFCKSEKPSKGQSRQSSSRTGVMRKTLHRVLDALGFTWVATMQIGSGCRVHLKADELPKGVVICRVSGHITCVVDGVLRDTFDCSRNGRRCVYGYWVKQ